MPDHKKINRARHRDERLAYEINASETDHSIASQIDPSKSLVVSGFWRSGTTWLQEYLAVSLPAKTIFEPFHFLAPGSKNLFKFYRILKKSQAFKELFFPYCAARSLQNYPLLMGDFDKALRADMPGPAVRVLRKSAEESHLPRVVVKFTRGQLCLRAAQDAFEMPIIHIYRDPRAVIASLKMTDWFWLFDHLSLQEQLLKVKDGRTTVFGVWAEAIAEYDQNKIAKIAAYWALSEKYLRDSFSDRDEKIAFVNYEALLRDKERLLPEVFEKLGVSYTPGDHALAQVADSFSTSEKRRGASLDERLFGWKNELAQDEIDAIESVVRHFGMEERLVNGD